MKRKSLYFLMFVMVLCAFAAGTTESYCQGCREGWLDDDCTILIQDRCWPDCGQGHSHCRESPTCESYGTGCYESCGGPVQCGPFLQGSVGEIPCGPFLQGSDKELPGEEKPAEAVQVNTEELARIMLELVSAL